MYIAIFALLLIIAILIAHKITNRYNIEKKSLNTTYQLKETKEIVKRGQIGEYKICQNLEFLKEYNCKILTNLYIPTSSGKTTEIDIVLITHKGIFVIESKNYKGWIYGNAKQKMWLQTFSNGTKKEFYNPLWQNYNHIKELKTLLKKDYLINSVIAFSDECELKKIPKDNANTFITSYSNVASKIIELCNFIPSNQLTEKEMDAVYKILLPYTQTNRNTKEKHIENIKNSIRDKNNKINNDSVSVKTNIELPTKSSEKCPLCGGTLRKITSKKTSKSFLGCSNYPKCKFAKSI